MSYLLHVWSQQIVQLGSDRLCLDDIGLVAVNEGGGQLVGKFAHSNPQPLVDTIRWPVGIGDIGRAQKLLEAVCIEWVLLQPVTCEEERRQRLEGKSIGVGWSLSSSSGGSTALVVLDLVENRIDQFLVVVETQRTSSSTERQRSPDEVRRDESRSLCSHSARSYSVGRRRGELPRELRRHRSPA